MRRIRRPPALLGLFVLLVLAVAQVAAVGHGGVLERSPGRGRRWRREEGLGRRQLDAGRDVLGADVAPSVGQSTSSSDAAASSTDSILASTVDTPFLTTATSSLDVSTASVTFTSTSEVTDSGTSMSSTMAPSRATMSTTFEQSSPAVSSSTASDDFTSSVTTSDASSSTSTTSDANLTSSESPVDTTSNAQAAIMASAASNADSAVMASAAAATDPAVTTPVPIASESTSVSAGDQGVVNASSESKPSKPPNSLEPFNLFFDSSASNLSSWFQVFFLPLDNVAWPFIFASASPIPAMPVGGLYWSSTMERRQARGQGGVGAPAGIPAILSTPTSTSTSISTTSTVTSPGQPPPASSTPSAQQGPSSPSSSTTWSPSASVPSVPAAPAGNGTNPLAGAQPAAPLVNSSTVTPSSASSQTTSSWVPPGQVSVNASTQQGGNLANALTPWTPSTSSTSTSSSAAGSWGGSNTLTQVLTTSAVTSSATTETTLTTMPPSATILTNLSTTAISTPSSTLAAGQTSANASSVGGNTVTYTTNGIPVTRIYPAIKSTSGLANGTSVPATSSGPNPFSGWTTLSATSSTTSTKFTASASTSGHKGTAPSGAPGNIGADVVQVSDTSTSTIASSIAIGFTPGVPASGPVDQTAGLPANITAGVNSTKVGLSTETLVSGSLTTTILSSFGNSSSLPTGIAPSDPLGQPVGIPPLTSAATTNITASLNDTGVALSIETLTSGLSTRTVVTSVTTGSFLPTGLSPGMPPSGSLVKTAVTPMLPSAATANASASVLNSTAVNTTPAGPILPSSSILGLSNTSTALPGVVSAAPSMPSNSTSLINSSIPSSSASNTSIPFSAYPVFSKPIPASVSSPPANQTNGTGVANRIDSTGSDSAFVPTSSAASPRLTASVTTTSSSEPAISTNDFTPGGGSDSSPSEFTTAPVTVSPPITMSDTGVPPTLATTAATPTSAWSVSTASISTLHTAPSVTSSSSDAAPTTKDSSITASETWPSNETSIPPSSATPTSDSTSPPPTTVADGTFKSSAFPYSSVTGGVTSSSPAMVTHSSTAIPSDSGSPAATASDSNGLTASSVTSTPAVTGSQVETWSTTSTTDSSSHTASYTSSSTDDAYTPSQTWLIVATASSTSTTPTATAAPMSTTSGTGTSTTASLPSTAAIPSSIPTMIVPADSAINQPNAGTGGDNDPLKDDTLIAILLAAAEYPWAFVVNSSDATSQLFNTFPALIGNALDINTSSVQTYGLMVYQPASWNGDEASLLTQWLAYIPSQYFAILNAYLKTQSSPLYNQTGIQGQLASQINTAYPLAAPQGTPTKASASSSTESSSSRTRNIVIGVCVSIGGLLWLGLVFWIYKRVKRCNERAVHRRLSEHMSMFSGHQDQNYGGTGDDRRGSLVPSIAASIIDDRPSSFYASPVENDRTMRQQQRESLKENQYSAHGSGDNETTYGPSVFGSSWFAQPQPSQMRQARASRNPFEDIVTKSYLTTTGSANGLSVTAQRRSALGKPVQVQKGMISQPTLQNNSLEFME